jgi:hypothetical protein
MKLTERVLREAMRAPATPKTVRGLRRVRTRLRRKVIATLARRALRG